MALFKRLKKNNSSSILSIEELEIEDKRQVEDDYIKNSNKLKLYEALQNLDANTREVIYLRLTGELSFKEIGSILHKSENWARVTFFRGKQKLNKEDIL